MCVCVCANMDILTYIRKDPNKISTFDASDPEPIISGTCMSCDITGFLGLLRLRQTGG